MGSQYAEEALGANQTKSQQSIARATIALWQAGRDGRLEFVAEGLRDLVAEQDLVAITARRMSRLNLAGILLWLGDMRDLRQSRREHRSTSVIRIRQRRIRGGSCRRSEVHCSPGHLDRGETLIAAVLDLPSRLGRDEACAEAAEIKVDFGDIDSAASLLDLGSFQARRAVRQPRGRWARTSPR